MNRPYSLNPLKRFNRNRQRVKRRLLPSELPSPFYHAHDINAVLDYFSGTAQERPQDGPDMSRGMRGRCYLCDEEVLFRIDVPADGSPLNWRETLVCPHCKLINRWRSCLHVFEAICEPDVDDRIYLTETLSPIYQNLAARFPRLSASEYFPDHAFGEMVHTHTMPVWNEDVTRLSFADASTDIILCFDVLEHVPDYRSALKEFHRVLDKGGQLVISVPFSFQRDTIVRARLDDAGNIEHLTEPCYHGDPLSDQGVLSYYDFGMDLLDELREAGFQECFLACYYSKEWAYLNRNVVYVARKLKSSVAKSTMAKLAWQSIRLKAGHIAERMADRFRYMMLLLPQPRVDPPHSPSPVSDGEVQDGDGINTESAELPELPEIFHYWSNKYLAAEMSRFGFNNSQAFFFQHTRNIPEEIE